ncbi:hypothetical protein EVAR_92331_1 [Eumeta japonica]|uniref:Uncharacterized protein n=1 Tax=Eumeta variegata TaxID=151549 RepID=A0A4C1TLZ2_EUMVA|nr:hypothetical protein EVAR_92331_1 [Eumeta japonica]
MNKVENSIPTQETGNALATALGLQVSMDDRDHLLSGGPHARLPSENAVAAAACALKSSHATRDAVTGEATATPTWTDRPGPADSRAFCPVRSLESLEPRKKKVWTRYRRPLEYISL